MNFINQMEPWFDEQEGNALNQYMNSGGWITEFKKTFELEAELKKFTGAKHCFMVSNGTISLTLMAMACGIEAGDEVLVPNYTMIATPNSIKMFGAVPIFIDVDPNTLCVSLKTIRQSVTSKTKAVFLMNANGRYPEDYAEIAKFCNENNLLLLEDSAQALGSFYPNGLHQGLLGNVGSFSFSAPKIISTGQGGAIVTNDDDIAYRVSRLKDFGRSGGGNDIHDSIGYNFKFTDIQAVIGLVQMEKLKWRVERMKEIYKRYYLHLEKLKFIKFFKQDLIHTTPWFIDVLVENRENLITHLKKNGVGTRVMYPPINKQKAYGIPGDYPISNTVGEKGLWLPSSSKLTNNQIDFVCNLIKQFYQEL